MVKRLTRQQVDDFLDRYKDPADARRFLQEAGLIDANGDLAKPYRPEPLDEIEWHHVSFRKDCPF